MATVIFEHSPDSGLGRLGRMLAHHGHRLRVIELHRGDPVPPDLDDVEAIVSCGGFQSANDEALEWLDDELSYLRAAHEAGLAVLGICLGSQILARALGGTVGPLEGGGIELGWHPVMLTPVGAEDPLHAGIAWSSMQPHWHREAVTKLPPGARLLGSSTRCNHQSWALGLRTYGFQYHPEMESDGFERWAATDPDGVREAGTTLEQLRSATREHYPACARLADRLFEQMALLLMPIDRRYSGLVKDLHH